MKTLVTIIFNSNFILKHRNDSIGLPADRVSAALSSEYNLILTKTGYSTISFDYDFVDSNHEAMVTFINDFLSKNYPEEDVSDLYVISFSEYSDESSYAESTEDKVDDKLYDEDKEEEELITELLAGPSYIDTLSEDKDAKVEASTEEKHVEVDKDSEEYKEAEKRKQELIDKINQLFSTSGKEKSDVVFGDDKDSEKVDNTKKASPLKNKANQEPEKPVDLEELIMKALYGDPYSYRKNDEDSNKLLNELIDAIIGPDDFKALLREIITVASEMKKHDSACALLNRSYLFSVGDGCGLTTYLNCLAAVLRSTDLLKLDRYPIIERTFDKAIKMDEVERIIFDIPSRAGYDSVFIRCIDISDWMDKIDSLQFRKFLRIAESNNKRNIIIFRIPFVEKDILSRINHKLNDLMTFKSFSFPPLSQKEIKTFADRTIRKYGYTLTQPAWKYFEQRIVEEKNDGRFYGFNTVKKVAYELIYDKQLLDAVTSNPTNRITAKETKKLVSGEIGNTKSAEEELNSLVGNGTMKEKIYQIIAQIQVSVADTNSSERPCIHMRFVGNPGTGKTTVARIVGKLLKEKGVLRVGNFFEYSGRDLVGRYIGETAPITAGICRDAYGSVLFIDEAYSLYRGATDKKDFGLEALETLIAEMENHRSDFLVIMAGYTDDMDTLLQGNAGLKSRMPYTIEFPNFTREELYQIFEKFVKSRFKYEENLLEAAKKYFMALPDELINSKEFSNARYVRNLYERTWAKASIRRQLNEKNEMVLKRIDFEQASSDSDFSLNVKKTNRQIGFYD